MILKVDHIGVAVKDLKNANELFNRLLGRAHYKVEEVESEKVSTSFFGVENTKIELLESTDPNGAIGKFIEKKGEGIHHIAFEVDDIYISIEELKKEGFQFINEAPKLGADDKLVCFIHPKTANGILVELCQSLKK